MLACMALGGVVKVYVFNEGGGDLTSANSCLFSLYFSLFFQLNFGLVGGFEDWIN